MSSFIRIAPLLLVCACAIDSSAANIRDLSGIHLTIVTVEDDPFVSVRETAQARDSCYTENGGSGCPKRPVMSSSEWNGWIISIIAEISAASGFTYSLQLPSGEKKTYGAADKDLAKNYPASVFAANRNAGFGGDQILFGNSVYKGNYPHDFQDGNGTASPNVMFSAAYITPNRIDDALMVSPFHQAPLSLLLRKPDKDWKQQTFQWLRPFTTNLWMLLIIVRFPKIVPITFW
jgi:hypothetical protein